MLKLKSLQIVPSREALAQIPAGKVLINTINAHSFNTAQKDSLFAEALAKGDYLIPDDYHEADALPCRDARSA